ncbi:MAG: hypothetical protein PPFGHCPK_00620 [Spiroplasma endosymbiont of Drosophila atripex]|nr:MAG: hypothetical protein PPFGHCPK_00620 [Spiroplasma endosymbiont of Drosophila atripex]
MINNQEQYKKIITIALNAIGAGSAGATTKLLHNARQVAKDSSNIVVVNCLKQYLLKQVIEI